MFVLLRRIINVAFVLCLMLFLLPIADAAHSTKDQQSALTILHTNDMHARIAPNDENGKTIGLAWFSSAVQNVKAQNPNTLWLDAGDTFHGLPRLNISKGENMVELLNLTTLDAIVPGNQDFNYGSDHLLEMSKALKSSMLVANIVQRKNQKFLFKPYKIFKMANGLKVGVFGLVTPDTAFKINAANLATIDFLDPIVQSKMMIAKLRSKVDVLIAVMHMGLDDSSKFTSERIARETQGIDVIIDGHSHDTLPEGLTVNGTLIAQAGCYGFYLGRVELNVKDHRVITKTAELLDEDKVTALAQKPDPFIENTLADIEVRNQKLLNEVVAYSDRPLTDEREIVRRNESEFGTLIADAYRWKTKADIAICNAAGFRRALPEGALTRGELLSIFPFGNTVQVHEIDGKTIRAMLERSVSAYPALFGGFQNISGMTFEYDASKPAGVRVGDIFINGNRIENTATYTIAASDFAFSGGDGYDMLKG